MTSSTPDSPREDSLSVSVVIPSLEGYSHNLERLSTTVLESGIPTEDLEIITAIGVSPNGRARDVGTLYARGEYLIFMDEDVSFPNPEDLATLVEFLRDHDDVGLVGPAQQIPPDTPDPLRKKAEQMPRSHVETPDGFKRCDMVTHACMAVERSVFVAVGMEHPNLISGTDPDLRNRIRQRGLDVGIVPGTRVFHPPIDSWSQLIKKNFRGGRRSRAVRRNYRKYHLPAEPEIDSADESNRHDTLSVKATQHLKRFADGITSGKTWWLTAQVSYLLGYGSEVVFPTKKVEPITYPDPPHPDQESWGEFLAALRDEGTVKRLHPAPFDTPTPQLGPAGRDNPVRGPSPSR